MSGTPRHNTPPFSCPRRHPHESKLTSSIPVLNAVDVLDLEDEGSAWLRTPPPIGTGLSAVRSQGFLNHARPNDLPDDQVWDWAGVAGPWAGTYAYLE